MNRTVPTSFFILLGLILITAGCHKQTDPAGDAGDMSGATISSDFPSVAQIPEFETPEIVSLTAEELAALGEYTDEELARFSVARKYQLAQQCLVFAASRPEEARALVERLGVEYLGWYDYILDRKKAVLQK